MPMLLSSLPFSNTFLKRHVYFCFIRVTLPASQDQIKGSLHTFTFFYIMTKKDRNCQSLILE